MTTAEVNTPPASWWYLQNHGEDVVRRLESLKTVNPSLGPVGAVTCRRGQIAVAFQKLPATALPQPWELNGREACLDWKKIGPGTAPDPDRPVYLVVVGASETGDLFALNLAAASRIRIAGDPEVVQGLVSRWLLELHSSHPDTTIGITNDVWPGPFTARVLPVSEGQVPHVDVLILGPDLTYAERSQIVSAASSSVLLDLGADAAVTTKWTITCGADLRTEIVNGANTLSTTAFVPGKDALALCRDLLVNLSPGSGAAPIPIAPIPLSETTDTDLFPAGGAHTPDDVDAGDPDAHWQASEPLTGHDPADVDAPATHGVDFFSPTPAAAPPGPLFGDDGDDDHWDAPEFSDSPHEPTTADDDAPLPPAPTPRAVVVSEPAPRPTSDDTASPDRDLPKPGPAAPVAAPRVGRIWNRILGPVTLTPPHGGEPDKRDKKSNELTVYLQQQSWASARDIIKDIYGGSASASTLDSATSVLRKRLGSITLGSEDKAFPTLGKGDSDYHLDKVVRSDWMEFERLVTLIPGQADTPHLIAAIELISGPPLGAPGGPSITAEASFTIRDTEWVWAKWLRDEIRTRVGEATAVLAERYRQEGNHAAALKVVEKGHWYDPLRQDLWRTALASAKDSQQTDTFRELRSAFLAKVPAADHDPVLKALI